MAFMVPIMKNNYDIYKGTDNALMMSKTAPQPVTAKLPRNSSGSSNKQQKVYRFMISGGKVVAAKPSLVNQNGRPRSATTTPTTTTTPSGRSFYRAASASISLPVKSQSKPRPEVVVAKSPDSPTKSIVSNGSTGSPPPNLRPMPHAKRTVRNPVTNRVYSYSVSIPDYVAEEDENEEFHDAEDDEDFEDEKNSDSSEEDAIVLFATSAPGGTGSIIDMASPKNRSKSHQKKSLDDHFTSQRQHRTLTQTSTSSEGSNRSSNSREYMELLRKFVLHLKMVKIFHGQKSSSSSSTGAGATKKTSKRSDANNNTNSSSNSRRMRKDTMEDTNNL